MTGRKLTCIVLSIIDRGGGKQHLEAERKLKDISLFEDVDFSKTIEQRLQALDA